MADHSAAADTSHTTVDMSTSIDTFSHDHHHHYHHHDSGPDPATDAALMVSWYGTYHPPTDYGTMPASSRPYQHEQDSVAWDVFRFLFASCALFGFLYIVSQIIILSNEPGSGPRA
jgi:hypothetical protein